jgi:hypothetical protein
MKINERLFPVIIIAAFVLFLLIALLLGFRPAHGGDSGSAARTSFMLLFPGRSVL